MQKQFPRKIRKPKELSEEFSVAQIKPEQNYFHHTSTDSRSGKAKMGTPGPHPDRAPTDIKSLTHFMSEYIINFHLNLAPFISWMRWGVRYHLFCNLTQHSEQRPVAITGSGQSEIRKCKIKVQHMEQNPPRASYFDKNCTLFQIGNTTRFNVFIVLYCLLHLHWLHHTSGTGQWQDSFAQLRLNVNNARFSTFYT